MSGIDIIVQRMSDHDYTSIAAGTAKTLGPIVLAELDTSQYREGTLEVYYKQSAIPTGCSITIDVLALGRTDDDPGKNYYDTNSNSRVARVTIDGTTGSNPILLRCSFAANFGAMVGVAITANSSTTAGTFTSTFQTNVCLKN